MDQERLIHAAKLNQDEQRCLEIVCTIMEKAENPAKRRETLQVLGKPGQPSSARQKLFEELAAGLGKEALAGQVGRYLFEKADIGLCDRILLPQKSLKGCSAYIMEQARKVAQNTGMQSLYVKDDEVFGWAEEYFRKDPLPAAALKKESRTRKEKSQSRRKKIEQEDGQMSLFDR